MDYFALWIVLVLVSLWISFLVFFWALRSGQFSDQDRARYIPLRGYQPTSKVESKAAKGSEVYILLGLIFLAVAVVVLAVILSVRSI